MLHSGYSALYFSLMLSKIPISGISKIDSIVLGIKRNLYSIINPQNFEFMGPFEENTKQYCILIY